MSFHRENVIWQSENKTWNIGFWEFYETGDRFDDDYDPEWDVEYRHDAFWFASTGHRTIEAAAAAYNGANPGGHWQVEYSAETAAEVAEYDNIAWAFKHPAEAEARRVAKFEAERAEKHAAILADFDARNIANFAGIQYSVSRKPGYNWALMTETARCTVDNGWVCIGGKQVFNPATREFAADVIDFKFVQPTPRYGYGYRGW